MSYDLWLYKSKEGYGRISTWEESHFEPLFDWPELVSEIRNLLTEISPGDSDEKSLWVKTSDSESYFEIVPFYDDNNKVETLTLKGASPDEAVLLARELEMFVFDPQGGEDIEDSV